MNENSIFAKNKIELEKEVKKEKIKNIKEKFDGINYNISKEDLEFLRSMEYQMNNVTGPYPPKRELIRRQKLLDKIGDN